MAKTIVVIGMGYVGIPLAALFADVDGFNVVGIQRRSKRSGWKIEYINSGKCPIGGNEPGLAELIARVVSKGTFKVTDDMSACKTADAIFYTIQTPVDADKIPRYETLKSVAAESGKYISDGTLVCIESTVAPGTTEHLVKPLLEEASGKSAGTDFYLAFSYERVMVGRLLHNLVNYPRIIGGINKISGEVAKDLYAHIVKSDIYVTDLLTAEVAKTVENAYRDVNIGFANEVALICESLGVNVFEVRNLVNNLPNDPRDPMTNPIRTMHFPGAGVGGHCLPKDSWLLKYGLDTYGKIKFVPNILVQSRKINDYMPVHMVELVEEGLKRANCDIKSAKISVLGYAFTKNSDDTRNTPAEPIINLLKSKGATVVVHDPYVRREDYSEINHNIEEVINNSDCLVIVTNHDEYYKLDLKAVYSSMRSPVIIDGRNVFDKTLCETLGFIYMGIGKNRD